MPEWFPCDAVEKEHYSDYSDCQLKRVDYSNRVSPPSCRNLWTNPLSPFHRVGYGFGKRDWKIQCFAVPLIEKDTSHSTTVVHHGRSKCEVTTTIDDQTQKRNGYIIHHTFPGRWSFYYRSLVMKKNRLALDWFSWFKVSWKIFQPSCSKETHHWFSIPTVIERSNRFEQTCRCGAVTVKN